VEGTPGELAAGKGAHNPRVGGGAVKFFSKQIWHRKLGKSGKRRDVQDQGKEKEFAKLSLV